MRGLLLSFLVMASFGACASAAPREPAPAPAAGADAAAEVRLRNVGEGLRLMQRGLPVSLREAGVTGEALVDLVLSADGTVQNARVFRASARELERPAVAAAERLRFSPPPAAGWPVRVRMQWDPRGGAIQVVGR